MAQAVQSVHFSKKRSPRSVNGGRGWTVATARRWLRAHGKKSGKADPGGPSAEFIKFRQFEPARCRKGSYAVLTENMPRGVQMVSCDAGD